MKRFIFLIVAIFSVMVAYTQTDKNMQEILMSKTWRWGDDPELYYELTFTHNSVISVVKGTEKHNYKGFNTHNLYYLSDTNDAEFIKSKIGKKQSGKYLVNEKLKTMKIISITEDVIKLGNINNNDGKGIIVYSAID